MYRQEDIKTLNLLNINETISKELFKNYQYPWEVLPKIKDFIIELGKKLNKQEYEELGKNIWVHKSAKIAKTVEIIGPCIIDENAELRHSAFIRENVIIGKNTVVGNSTELKNAILFNNVQVPHYNYVGDSILGFKSHLGAGAIISNLKADKTEVKIKGEDFVIETNLKKFGAIIGDESEIGCSSVLNPGTIIGKNTSIYPLCSVRGIVGKNSIYKNERTIIEKSK